MHRLVPYMLLALLALAVPAVAEEAAKTTPPGSYTGDSLFESLGKLGFKPSRDTGTSGSYIVVTAAQMDVTLRLSLSGTEQYVWLRATLGTLDPSEISAEVARKFVSMNDEIGPAFYSYDSNTQQIFLHYRYANRDFTQAKLRKAVQTMTELVRKERPNWRSDNFVRLATVPSEVQQPALDQLQGGWRLVEYNDRGTVSTAEQLAAIKGPTLRFEGNRLTIVGKTTTQTIVLDPRRSPMAMDMTESDGGITPTIFKLEGDRLTILTPSNRSARPKSFTGNKPTDFTLLVLERIK